MKIHLLPLCTCALLPVLHAADPAPTFAAPPAPPAPPPVLVRALAESRLAAPAAAAAATGTLYSIGAPTDEEQYYLELINRARANPTAEGIRLDATTDPSVVSAYLYFHVDRTMMKAEFAALSVRPPLAPNAQLTAAARAHTTDLYTNAFQGHVGTDGRTLGQRVTAAGYTWTSLGENVFSYAAGVWPGHAGFEVDWGGSVATGGMQSPRGHRANIHGNFREVGIGVINGTNTANGNSVGPQLVTQDFGTSSQVFVTGVAYYDLDGDNFYTPGEGVGGVTVDVAGASFHAVTANSGGYAVPIPSATAAREVTFTSSGVTATRQAACIATQNTKVDLQLAYTPPTIAGSATPYLGRTSSYTFNAIPGATAYDLRRSRKLVTADDPAEALTNVAVSITGSYSALSTAVKNAGGAAYRLAHPTPALQTLTYPGLFYAGSNAALSFYSRLGWATTTQIARVEASLDGALWTPLYSQSGTGTAGESSFTLRTASLAAYAGRFIHLRFSYAFNQSYYPQTSDGVGWYIDSITFSNLFTPTDTATEALTGPAFPFTPTSAETYLLAVRPVISGRNWNYGPIFEATGTPLPPFIAWAAAQESAAGLAPGTIENDPSGDYNGDGVPNLAAYALGLGAVAPATAPAAASVGNQLTLRYPHDLTQTDISVTPEVSTDLVAWYAPGDAGAPAGFADNLVSTAGTAQAREASVPLASGGRLFLRLRITRP